MPSTLTSKISTYLPVEIKPSLCCILITKYLFHFSTYYSEYFKQSLLHAQIPPLAVWKQDLFVIFVCVGHLHRVFCMVKVQLKFLNKNFIQIN